MGFRSQAQSTTIHGAWCLVRGALPTCRSQVGRLAGWPIDRLIGRHPKLRPARSLHETGGDRTGWQDEQDEHDGCAVPGVLFILPSSHLVSTRCCRMRLGPSANAKKRGSREDAEATGADEEGRRFARMDACFPDGLTTP